MRVQATAIRARWAGQWSHTITAYQNESFTPTLGTPWVRLAILPADAFQATLGRPSRDRHAGLVAATIFVPIGEGTTRALWLADKAATVYRKQTFDGITFRVPVIAEVGNNDEGWFVVNVQCPYWFDE